jgi:HK97 family phage prohead protease
MALKGRTVVLVESKQAQAMLRAGQSCDVRKDGAAIEREMIEGKISFVLTDETKDRYGDVVAADGWNLDNFNKNRVLLWAHDYSAHPVGKLAEPKQVGKKLKASVEEWVGRELSEFAWATEQMVRRGFLNAVSVGFRPEEYSYNEDYSINYLQQELLEVSVVPVPANPNALVAAKSAGLWVPEIEQWVERQMDERPQHVSYTLARRAWEVLKAPGVAVPARATSGGADESDPLPELFEKLTAAVERQTNVMIELNVNTKNAAEGFALVSARLDQMQKQMSQPVASPDPGKIAARALELATNPTKS